MRVWHEAFAHHQFLGSPRGRSGRGSSATRPDIGAESRARIASIDARRPQCTLGGAVSAQDGGVGTVSHGLPLLPKTGPVVAATCWRIPGDHRSRALAVLRIWDVAGVARTSNALF